MKTKIYNIAITLVAILLTACTFGKQWDVDFESIPTDQNMFQVSSRQVTEVNGIPDNCYLMGEKVIDLSNNPDINFSLDERENSTMHRAASTSMANVLQNIFNFGQRNKVVELTGTYQSTDLENQPIRLSGKVVIPADGKAKGIIFVSHYTMCNNAEVPSNAFPLEAVLAHRGYVMIFPDYLGYGVTADQQHPYLVLEKTMENLADMLYAVVPFLKAAKVDVDYRKLMLMGYSQGGANTMALLYYLENFCPGDFDIHRVFAGGGPYDVLATYDRFVETDTTGYPVAVPLVLYGMIKGNHLDLNFQDMVQPYIAENMDKWINSKSYTSAEVNRFINTKVTHEILSERGMDRTSAEVAELYKAMTENSILSYSWTPQSPIYLFHSMDDETVTFTNASRARAKWTNANIQYNFGHYGTHQKGCLRFIFSVRTLLEQEDKEN